MHEARWRNDVSYDGEQKYQRYRSAAVFRRNQTNLLTAPVRQQLLR